MPRFMYPKGHKFYGKIRYDCDYFWRSLNQRKDYKMGEYLRNSYMCIKENPKKYRLERIIIMQDRIIIAQFLLILILIFG